MRSLMLWFAIVALLGVAVPAVASNVYDNGPVNGESDAWTLNYGFSVTDSFVVSNGNGSIGGMNFWAWVSPGDTITSIQVQIGTEQFGDELMNAFVNVSQSSCSLNTLGYDVCEESAAFTGPNLGNGSYWLTLQNANVPSGNPVYWDENSGVGCQSRGCPSQATCNTCITNNELIPSEAFTLLGQGTSTGTTPEPSSFLLFGSGFLVVFGLLRRRFS